MENTNQYDIFKYLKKTILLKWFFLKISTEKKKLKTKILKGRTACTINIA